MTVMCYKRKIVTEKILLSCVIIVIYRNVSFQAIVQTFLNDESFFSNKLKHLNL